MNARAAALRAGPCKAATCWPDAAKYSISSVLTNLQLLSPAEPCNTAACGAFTWQLSPWSACSATCGDSGTTTRNATCLHNGQPVDSSSDTYFSSCLPLGQPTTVKPCLATPCNSYLWQLGPWSGCSNGQQTRPVTCQSIKGGIASNSVSCLSTHSCT